MFEFLKKKISDFSEKIKEKIAGVPKPVAKEIPEQPTEKAVAKGSLSPGFSVEKAVAEEKEFAAQEIIEKPQPTEHKPKAEKAPELKKEKQKEEQPEKKTPKKEEKSPFNEEKKEPIYRQEKPFEAAKKEPVKEEINKEIKQEIPFAEPKHRKEEKHELKAKVSLATKLKGIIKSTITISEADLESLLFELELSLLESDVEQNAASEIVSSLRKELSGKEIEKSSDVSEVLKDEIRKSLAKVMDVKHIDLFREAEMKKPLVILFLGPNGSGKTTSIAKLSSMFLKKGKSVVWAAADTFRAASIEQLEEHAKNLKVHVVKHKYGSDPAAVAFDAIESAKAHSADVVMIDSAGRQETNKNLMEELKKIVRVAKPDFKVYVGESYAGQSLLNQAQEFDKSLGIDGFILTKVDADAKGGTAISLLYTLKKPILFIGTGQEYDKLIQFEPNFIIDRIV